MVKQTSITLLDNRDNVLYGINTQNIHPRFDLISSNNICLVPGEENCHHFLVASQDQELRRKLRRLPGVPLMHIIKNTVVLEKPSDRTVDKAEDVS